jgi:hypothetical protein
MLFVCPLRLCVTCSLAHPIAPHQTSSSMRNASANTRAEPLPQKSPPGAPGPVPKPSQTRDPATRNSCSIPPARIAKPPATPPQSRLAIAIPAGRNRASTVPKSTHKAAPHEKMTAAVPTADSARPTYTRFRSQRTAPSSFAKPHSLATVGPPATRSPLGLKAAANFRATIPRTSKSPPHRTNAASSPSPTHAHTPATTPPSTPRLPTAVPETLPSPSNALHLKHSRKHSRATRRIFACLHASKQIQVE